MNQTTYTVITLDQKENKNVSLETIQDWYSKRLIHEDSLVYSPELGQWQMLEKAFNLLEFPPRAAYRQSPHLSINTSILQPAQKPQLSSLSQNSYHNHTPQPPPNTFRPNQIRHVYEQPKSSSTKKIITLVGILVFVISAIGGYFVVSTVLRAVSLRKEDEKLLAELKKIEIPGKSFTDPETGAMLSIPNSWRFIQPQNKIIPVDDAKILATDQHGNKTVMLEVVTFTNERGQPLILPASTLDTGIVKIEELLRSQSRTYSSTLNTTVTFKDELGRKIVYERTNKPSASDSASLYEKDMIVKGQIILTIRGNRIYIFQTWCPKEDYDNAMAEFTQLENNLFIPPFQNRFN